MRERLYSLMRYCSARSIGPSSVDDKSFSRILAVSHRDDSFGDEQYRPPFYGAGVECLRGCN